MRALNRFPQLLLFFLAFAYCAQAQELRLDTSKTTRDSIGGRGSTYVIHSAILNQDRRINVSLPASFAASSKDRKYPVVIVFDGEAYLPPAAAVSEQLTRHGLMPESVIVAIENTDQYGGRVHDLTPPGISVSGSSTNEGGDNFLDFIERELLPAVDKQLKGGAPRTLVGHSSGAILALYAGATRCGFPTIVAIDAPMHLADNWLAKKMTAGAKAAKYPLRLAFLNTRFEWPDAEWSQLEKSMPANWRVYREKLRRENHESAFMIGAYVGLREVFADYSKLSAPVSPTTSILPYYDKLETAYGTKMVPPARLLREVVEDLLMEGRGSAARRAFALLTEKYGPPGDKDHLLAQIAEVEKQPEPSETVEGLLATPFPSLEEIRPYLGEWRGNMWMKPGLPDEAEKILRIRLKEGKVSAELEYTDIDDPKYRFREIEYLKVTPNGLTFGFMNGMRPRGMILHEGSLRDGVLAGKTRWGGINFKYPADMDPPDPGFEFKKVSEKASR